jgi:hypothetical protein
MPKTHSSPAPIEGAFKQIIFSPEGAIEGALIDVDGAVAQLVVDKHDESIGAQLRAIEAGQKIVAVASESGPSNKGPSEHPIYALSKLRSVDGAKPIRAKAAPLKAGYVGSVAAFNYARHGEKNGVVLDTGNFIHLKPEGFAKLKLRVGDRVEVDGDAWPLSTGAGYAVEAATVNGKPVFRKPK